MNKKDLFFAKLKRKLGYKYHQVYLPLDKYTQLDFEIIESLIVEQGFKVGYTCHIPYYYAIRVDLK